MTQLPLVAVAANAKLTPRQAKALEFLQESGPAGIQAVALGARMHDWAGKHPAGVTCDWCLSAGNELLSVLRRKGLARHRRPRGGIAYWQATELPEPSASFGEFPKGF